jgi:hypothetical protein
MINDLENGNFQKEQNNSKNNDQTKEQTLNEALEIKAQQVLNTALQNSTSTVNCEACQEVYDSCKSISNTIGLIGTWTITRSTAHSDAGTTWICSGGILVKTTNTHTRGGLSITASFVAGTRPVGSQEVM